MDLWVVAAAAGAGYVAKYWQQFTSKEENPSSSEPASGDLVYGDSDSRKLFQKFRDQALPLPKLGKKQLGHNRSGYGYGDDDDDGTGIGSTSGGDFVDGNVLSLMNLSTGVCGNASFQEFGYSDKRKSELSIGETGLIRIGKHRNVVNRSNGYLVKPVSSLESCLTSQYVYCSIASPSVSNVRPLLVTNGRRVISRASSEVRRDSGLEEKEMRSRMGSIELPRRRSKVSFAKQRRSSRFSISSTRAPEEGAYPSQGSSNGMLLFFLGITIGIMSTVAANQRELDRLNSLLKKSESLVQDLQEELEMKEFSTMKELDEHSNEQDPDKPTSDDDKSESGTEKAELMNSIEAELEAELQKLELSMKTSRLERISKIAELDPGFIPDIAEGELDLDRANSNQDISETSTTELYPSDYAVPPMELSLRLHELIQSRLEARILELEAALENSEQRRHSMAYSESDRSLSTQGIPVCVDEPMVMNLSGEALDAYNEAYEEMYKISDIDPENEYDERLARAVEEKISRSLSSNGLRESEEEEEEDDDEMEKLLIKQIVERTKGSDAVLSILNSLKDQ